MATEWATYKIGDLAADDDGAIAIGPFGSSMKADVYTDSGIPVVRGNNLTGQLGFHGDFVFVPPTVTDRFPRCLVKLGDLVFPHRGAIGEVGLVINQGYSEWMLSTSMMKLRVHLHKLDPHFVFYFFRSPLGRHQLLRNASQVGTPGISQPLTSLKACEITVPPLDDQRAIAAVLGSLDDKIEQNRRTGRKLEEMARAVFKAWFVDFEPVKAKAAGATAFPGMPPETFATLPNTLKDSPLGPVPQGWEVKPLSAICKLVSGGTPKRSEPNYWGGDVPWYSVKDAPADGMPWVYFTDEQITLKGLDESAANLVPTGCTIISARGTVGKLAMVGREMTFNQSCYGLLPSDGRSFRYLNLLMNDAVVTLQQRTHGSVFDTITRQTFDGILVVAPPAVIVEAFDRAVTPVFDLQLAQLKESAKLATLRDYLLPRLLSGRVRVGANGNQHD